MIKQKKGKIINTASVSSARGHPNLAVYSASKGGVTQFTKVLANEWLNLILMSMLLERAIH